MPSRDGRSDCRRATSRLDMTIPEAAFYALDAWQMEVYHRDLKQFTGVERCQYRLEISQRNHIGLAIRGFVRLEVHRLRTGISWFEAKTGIIRSAMRLFLAHPTITLGSTAEVLNFLDQDLQLYR